MDEDGKYKDDTWFMDRAREWLENKQIQFRDNIDLPAGAVNSFDDLTFIRERPGFNLEGAAGIIISSFSEIVDVFQLSIGSLVV